MVFEQTGSRQEPMQLLIAEMNHRWFNGLQVIQAALNLCSRQAASPDVMRRNLAAVSTQIQAMAALHRRLTRLKRVGAGLERHCRALCMDLALAFGRTDVLPNVAMVDAGLCARSEQHLALIVVELMTNALKHGRPPASGGVVWIQLRFLGEAELELVVTDNFEPPAATEAPAPVMVAALVEDLGGDLKVCCRPTYRTRARFPIR
ncbi:MAG: signal transduction histidine kinase [Phenylobacterium sp.]|nr:signal transduction histidine kinase [Phenylobacterium sp.]